AFFANTLKAGYVADDAGTYNASGTGPFSGLALSFDDGERIYDVDYPDVLSAPTGSQVLMTYSGGAGGAAGIGYVNGSQRVVTLGFPFEAITSESARVALMDRVLDYMDVTP